MAPPPIIDLTPSSDVRFRDIVARDQYQVTTTGNLTRKIYHHITQSGAANVSAMEVVSAIGGSHNAQFDLLMSTSTTSLSLANITTANISTWSASSFLSLRGGTTFLRSANVEVGNMIASTISGTIPNLNIVGNDEAKLDNWIVKSFQKTLGATAGSGSDICSIQNTNGAFAAELNVIQSESSTVSISKCYKFSVRHNATANTWQRLVPLSSSSSTDWGVEIRVNNATTTLRLVRLSGSTTVNVECTLTMYQSRTDPVTMSASTTSNTGLTFATTLYETTLVSQVRGNVGIGTDTPSSLLTVNGPASVEFLDSANGIIGSTVSTVGRFLDTTVLPQGAYMSWNHSGGDGHTDFVCKRGGGLGGYAFWRSDGDNTALSVGKTNLALLTESGFELGSGQSFWASGAIIGSLMATGRDSNINAGVTISPTSLTKATYGTNWVTVATFSYTPKSTSSRLHILFDIDYVINNYGYDYIDSRMTIDGTRVVEKEQLWGDTSATGSGTRSNTIFPLCAAAPNTTLSSRTIRIELYMNGTDDTLALSSNNWTFELLERQI